MRLFHGNQAMQAHPGTVKARLDLGMVEGKKPPTNSTTRGSSHTAVPHRYLCLAEIPPYTRQRKENWLTNNKTSRHNITSKLNC